LQQRDDFVVAVSFAAKDEIKFMPGWVLGISFPLVCHWPCQCPARLIRLPAEHWHSQCTGLIRYLALSHNFRSDVLIPTPLTPLNTPHPAFGHPLPSRVRGERAGEWCRGSSQQFPNYRQRTGRASGTRTYGVKQSPKYFIEIYRGFSISASMFLAG
jgi:hypothetical protein